MRFLLIPLFFLLYKMFSFPANVEAKLAGLSLTFSLQVRTWFMLCKVLLGIDMVIVSGLRTAAEQDALHRQNPKNPPASAGSSHQSGRAVDVNGYKDGKIVLLKNSSPAQWSAAVSLAKRCGLGWGGLFKGYYDGNHFYEL
jgi:hypothetical protein